MTAGVLSRELTGKIVSDLARATRTVQAIAARHDVPVATVTRLRDSYGPDVAQLLDAAEELRRPPRPVVATPPTGTHPPIEVVKEEDAPVVPDAVEVVVPPEPQLAVADRLGRDGLTQAERRACREWANANGNIIGKVGLIAAPIVDDWNQLGRPFAPGVEVVDHDTVETTPIVAVEVPAPTPVPVIEFDPDAVSFDEYRSLAVRGDFLNTINQLIDLVPWASMHARPQLEELREHIEHQVEQFKEQRLEGDLVEAAAQSLHQLALQGLLTADIGRMRAAARVVLASVSVVPEGVPSCG